MTLNVNSTEMSVVNVNGTRMEVVNVNGTEVYRAQNGNVTLLGNAVTSFTNTTEDLNRHFVLVGSNFSGSNFGTPPVPTINGTSCAVIQNVVFNNGDGGVAGIFTFKAPTGSSFSIGNVGIYSSFTVYRVIGCTSMLLADALFSGQRGAGQTPNNITGAKTSSANGCFFAAAVSNFSNAPQPSPNSSGLSYNAGGSGHRAASNTTTGPTQTVSIAGDQANVGAIFAYTLF